MGSLPLLVQHPVRHEGGHLQLAVSGQPLIPLLSGDTAIENFNDGWHAELLFTLLHPLWVLVLRHRNGDVATWHVTSDGVLAAPPHQRPQAERKQSASRLQNVALWCKTIPGALIRLPIPDAVRAYASLPIQVRRELDLLLAEPLAPFVPDAETLAAFEPSAPGLGFERIGESQEYLVGNPDAMVPMLAGDVPAQLQPGWRIDKLGIVFAPLLTVVLRHEDGAQAAWFIDLNGRRISHHASLLPPDLRQHLAEAVAPLFDCLWKRVVLGKQDVPITAPDGIADLPDVDLGDLVPTYLEGLEQDGETRVWLLDQDLPPGLAYVIPTRHGLRACQEATVLTALVHGLHSEMDRLLRDGRMCWPSPVDGVMIESDGFALLLAQNCFAYRFCDEAAGLVFYVVCAGTHFYNHALYFPTANLLVARDGNLAAVCRPLAGNGRQAILRHLAIHHHQLAAGCRTPRDETVQQFFGACGIHIGHYVWQDLAGLAYMLRRIEPDRALPHLQMFSIGSTNRYFGDETRIFPQFEGRVTRHEGSFGGHVGTFYRLNQRVIQYTAISVPAELGPLVRAAGDATPELQAARAAADAAAARPAPVILVGIRVGNRTMQDMDDFAADLLIHLGKTFPGCTVILDGQNDQHDVGSAMLPDLPPGSDLAAEIAIGRRLEMLSRANGVHLIDNINRSALRSVVWCSRADCFLALLGAALAKYRWICNTPGLVLSSRWNLQHRRDLRIYDAPAALEGSSEMQFCSIDDIHDVDPETDVGGHDGRGNFTVDRDGVFAQFDALVRRQSAARLAALDPEEAPDADRRSPRAATP